jgi:hypothetical protein
LVLKSVDKRKGADLLRIERDAVVEGANDEYLGVNWRLRTFNDVKGLQRRPPRIGQLSV